MRLPRVLCTGCKKLKGRCEFHKKPDTRNGLRMPCKECQRPARAALMKRRRREDEGVRLRQQASTRRWHEKNPDYERQRSKRRYLQDPVYRARVRAAAKAWAAANPEAARIYASKRRSLTRGGDLTVAQVRAVFDAYLGMCAYCPAEANTIDHVVPLSKGGLHTASNIVPACKACNSRKHNRDGFVPRKAPCPHLL